jgi:hypothetical protein
MASMLITKKALLTIAGLFSFKPKLPAIGGNLVAIYG